MSDEQGPPVPIPNTEVKLFSADDTKRETAGENRSMLTLRSVSFAEKIFENRIKRRNEKRNRKQGNQTKMVFPWKKGKNNFAKGEINKITFKTDTNRTQKIVRIIERTKEVQAKKSIR